MRIFLIIFLYVFIAVDCFAQNVDNTLTGELNQLHEDLKMATIDTTRINIWNDLGDYYKFSRADSAIYYTIKALKLAKSISFNYGELRALQLLNISYQTLGNYSKSLRISLEGLRVYDALKNPQEKRIIWHKGAYQLSLGSNYFYLGEYKTSLTHYIKAINVFEIIEDPRFISIINSNIGRSYRKLNHLDSALYFCHKALSLGDSIKVNWVLERNYRELGRTHRDLNNLDSSLYYYRKAIGFDFETISKLSRSIEFLEIAKLLNTLNKIDSSIYFAEESMRIAVEYNLYSSIIDASLYLSNFYHESDPYRSLDYSKKALAYKDSISNLSNLTSFVDFVDFDEQQRQYEVEASREASQSRIRMNAFLGSIFTLVVIVFFLFRNNRTKQRAKREIEKSYEQLKSTQTQLIQSEKMASLGELTAGIAHEIQNPLNFVNNFSEVSEELVTELKVELEKGDLEEAKAISEDVKENLKKINHHGQRASGIVKGMLQHSRTSTGDKELTDINALADEYLRLAYHGLRAKDKSFNADFKTELDESIPKINVVPQDIGRVLLNLINNAFQAVREVEKPKVTVTTKQVDNKLVVTVSDNGPGIADDIKDKIFQPFFTTKAAGEGTGLGLSLSYDIITKGHGGKLSVATKEGEGSMFTINLPAS